MQLIDPSGNGCGRKSTLHDYVIRSDRIEIRDDIDRNQVLFVARSAG